MENVFQLAEIASVFYNWFAMRGAFHKVLLFSVLFLASCAGNLTGIIFLDENGNNKRDDGEGRIADLSFAVTKDDEDFDDGQTDGDGEYSVAVGGAGEYCVEVTEGGLSGTNDDGSAPALVSALQIGTRGSIKRQSTDTDDDSDSTDTTTDTDDDSTTDDTTSDDSTDSTDDTTDDTTTTDEESETSSATAESGKACNKSSGGFGLELDVPIAMDYATGVESIEDPADRTVSRGDRISLSVIYPESCEFDLIYLPLSVTPVAVPSDSYDSTTGLFNFATAIAATTVTESEGIAVHHDDLNTYTLTLDIDQDGSLDTKSVTITPTMSCPDDETVTLKAHNIEINSEEDLEVTNDVTGTKTYGGALTVTTTVVNNSGINYDDSQVELSFSGPTFVQNLVYSTLCDDAGEAATCTFDIDAGETVQRVTTFTLPSTLTENTTFEMTVTLTITSEGTTLTIEDTVSVSLAANTTS